jgi:hypothetical protein
MDCDDGVQYSESLGLWTLSTVQKSKYNVSENRCASVLRKWRETPTLLGPLGKPNQWLTRWLRLNLCKESKRVGVSFPYLRTETDPVSETLYLEFRMMDTVQKASISQAYDILYAFTANLAVVSVKKL